MTTDDYSATPHHGIPIPDDEWRAAQEAAWQRGDNLPEIVRATLRDYVKATDVIQPKRSTA